MIDAGNTLVKLASHDGAAWGGRVRIPLVDFPEQVGELVSKQAPTGVMISNVAGDLFSKPMQKLLATWNCPAMWVRAQSSAYGVVNGYANPTQLGADRWAALVGVRKMCSGNVLVASVGTAVTIDVMRADGQFEGGIIMPGPEMMIRCLSEKTQGIGAVNGTYERIPKSTDNAVYSGALAAIVGAIENMAGYFTNDGIAFELILTGGGADKVAPHLNIPPKIVPDLVLEGLLAIASMEGLR